MAMKMKIFNLYAQAKRLCLVVVMMIKITTCLLRIMALNLGATMSSVGGSVRMPPTLMAWVRHLRSLSTPINSIMSISVLMIMITMFVPMSR